MGEREGKREGGREGKKEGGREKGREGGREGHNMRVSQCLQQLGSLTSFTRMDLPQMFTASRMMGGMA